MYSPFGCLCSNYRQSVLKAALLCTSLPKTESSTTTQLLRRRRACSYEKNTAATAFLRFYCCFKTEDVEAKSSLVVEIVSTPEKITTTSSTQVAASVRLQRVLNGMHHEVISLQMAEVWQPRASGNVDGFSGVTLIYPICDYRGGIYGLGFCPTNLD